MNRPWHHGAAYLTTLALLAACSSGEGSDAAGEGLPDPVAADELDPVSPPNDTADLVDTMSEQMERAQTVRVEMAEAPDLPEDADPIEETTVDLRLTDPPAAVMEVVESDKETPTTTHIVVVYGVIYTNLAGEEIIEGKPWMRLADDDVAAAEEELGMFARIFTTILDEVDSALEQASGGAGFELVRHGELTEGPTPVGGDEGLTEYSGVTALRDLPEEETEAFEEYTEDDSELDVSWTLTVTDRGLPHDYTVSAPAEDGEGAVSTVTFREWGQELDVQAPDEEQVATLEEMLAE